jgi:hypothetical protein
VGINALTYGAAAGPGGELVHEVDICLDLPALASSGRYLSPARTIEFAAAPSRLSVELIVGFATQACLRMFYRLVDAVGSEVEAASGLCVALHREAADVGGAPAVFTTDAELFVCAKSWMEMRADGHDQVVGLHDLLPEIVRAVSTPVHVPWDDLTAH